MAITDTVSTPGSEPDPEGEIRTVGQITAQHRPIDRAKDKALGIIRKLEKKLHSALDGLARAEEDQRSQQDSLERADRALDALGKSLVSDKTLLEDAHGPWFSKRSALIVAVVAVFGLWFVDQTLLLVLLLPVGTTRILTATIVAASAVTAYIAGVTRKRWSTAEHPQLQISVFERVLGMGSITIGLTIEIGLAVVRAVITRGLLTSIMLGAAGVGLWLLVSYTSYLAHDGLATRRRQLEHKRDKERHLLDRDNAVVEKRKRGVAMAQNTLCGVAAEHVAHINDLIVGAIALHRRSHPYVSVDRSQGLPWLDELTAISKKELASCCKIPPSKSTEDPS